MSAVRESLPRDRKRNRLEYQLTILYPALAAIVVERERMLQRWWDLYSSRFAAERSLSQDEFGDLGSGVLANIGTALLRGDIESSEARVRRRWHLIARRGLPFAEAMVIVHLFEESALSAVGELHRDLRTRKLLSQCVYQCVPLIADAYLRAGMAAATEMPPAEPFAADGDGGFHGLVASSAPMRSLYRRIEAVGRSGSTALIVGKTGTGKELVARAIHECGPRPDAPFVAVNRAARHRDDTRAPAPLNGSSASWLPSKCSGRIMSSRCKLQCPKGAY